MMIKSVQNLKENCVLLDKNNSLDYMYINAILSQSKSKDQLHAAFDLKDCGYTLVTNIKKVDTLIDRYITRVQKKFEKTNELNPEYELKIYYGRIGLFDEFGYYLYMHEKK